MPSGPSQCQEERRPVLERQADEIHDGVIGDDPLEQVRVRKDPQQIVQFPGR